MGFKGEKMTTTNQKLAPKYCDLIMNGTREQRDFVCKKVEELCKKADDWEDMVKEGR